MSKYVLVKLSAPGFSLETDDILTVLSVLEGRCCYDCINLEEYELGKESYSRASFYDMKTVDEKIDHLLDTQCGAEFMLEELGNENVN